MQFGAIGKFLKRVFQGGPAGQKPRRGRGDNPPCRPPASSLSGLAAISVISC